jgi:hypothetical protein
MNKKTQGKKNRESGARFERKVRADLESKGWIVDRWTNNVEFDKEKVKMIAGNKLTKVNSVKLVPAKSRFNMRTTGFPDFIAFKLGCVPQKIYFAESPCLPKTRIMSYGVVGVECKSNGYLTKEEKEKCRWYLDNNKFSKILIAKKGKKRGEIEYVEFK